MLLIIAAVLIVLWCFGLLGHIGGGLVNILLIIAVVVVVLHFVRGRRTA